MHRSGTSALARTLSLLGGSLPEDLVPPNAGNPHGHWEPSGMVALNDRMLADAGSDLYSAVDIGAAWFASAAAERFAAEAEDLARRTFSGDVVVLKDPRTALLAPIWNRALDACGYRVVHVIPLRHPADVAESLRRRHLKEFPYDAWVTPRGEAVWLRYLLASLRGTDGHMRVLVRYSDLLSDWRSVAARIAGAAELSWPRAPTEASPDIEAFLHTNARAEPERADDPQAASPEALGVASLAAALYGRLVHGGEAGTDAVAESFARRVSGLQDLILTLEDLYPVVWRFLQAGEAAEQRLALAATAEADLRANLQRTWAALTQANSDKLALQQVVASQQHRIGSIEGEMAGHVAAAQAHQARAVAAETASGRRDAELAEARGRAAAAEARLTVMEARLAATEASSSWRITAPIRTLARKFLGRA